jgi:N-acetylmuramoyl-L-alanine amidase
MHNSNIHIKIVTRFVLTIFLVFVLSLQILSAQNKEVVAKNGDGIFKLLTRNGLDPALYTNAFIELNKTRLGKNNTLFTGVNYKLPNTENKTQEQPATIDASDETQTNSTSAPETPTNVSEPAVKANSKTINFKIFGSKYNNIEIKSNELKGAIFYLKSGHGGPDPGAIGKYQNHQVCEDEYAYDVTLRLAKNLIEKGATVYMITIDKNDGIRDDSFLMADKDEPQPYNSLKSG